MSKELSSKSHFGGQDLPRRPHVIVVVAAAENGVIGRGNALPWRLPDDLKRFKALTMGKPIIMGRKTFESIGKPLPGRANIVLTTSVGFAHAGVIAVSSLAEALTAAGDAEAVCVIGGAAVYREALAIADEVQFTLVHAATDGDAFFAPLDPTVWEEVASEHRAADERHAYAMTFKTMRRREAA
jgi:dihydrofolate reductase